VLKFNRNYVLTIEGNDGSLIEIKPPITIDIDVNRNYLSSANVASIRIYNLSERNRSQIRKDNSDYGLKRKIILKAGYGNNLSEILNGSVTMAFSVREGVNFITEVQVFDGGFAYVNSQIDKTYPENTANRTVVLDMISSLKEYGVSPGAVGNFEGNLSRANSYSGNTTSILREITNGSFFIDNNKAYCLKDDECVAGEVQVINSESGLLGTPRREQTFLTFDIIFQPSLRVGQRIKLESITGANFNGIYKVVSIKHRGMISESVGGTVITTLGLFYGYEKLNTVQEIVQ